MRALVTGATGFIGGAVARALLARGCEVTALARSPERAGALEDVAVVAGDVTDRASVRTAVADHDAVFHLAAWYELGVRDVERMDLVNVTGSEIVLEEAADAGVDRIVYCSSVAALGSDPGDGVGDERRHHSEEFGSAYEQTKWRAHQRVLALARAGVPVVLVMPGATYGPGDRSVLGFMLSLYARRMLRACPFQEAGLSWVHVDDVADGIVKAFENGVTGEEYVVAGDNEEIGGMFRRVAPLTGIAAPRRLPRAAVRAAVPFGPLIARALGREPGLLREGLASLRGSWMFSSAKAQRALGYRFRAIEDGIPDTVRALRGAS